jgi:hypothetical protein
MEKFCDACQSNRLRPSRFRLSDIIRLFIFKFPVRCVFCQERSYASISWVIAYKRSHTRN